MNITINTPGPMRVVPEREVGEQAQVYIATDGDSRAILLWIDPATAAQWIEALTPIAEAKP